MSEALSPGDRCFQGLLPDTASGHPKVPRLAVNNDCCRENLCPDG